MSDKKSKKWIICFISVVVIVLATIICLDAYVDPFFQYHKPYTDKYFYSLSNQRSQNPGIIKKFDYDAIITGTSMTENFKTSEMNQLFNTKAIKVPFDGGTFKEINDAIKLAIQKNPKVKIVVRSIDETMIIQEKNAIRTDLGTYPTYLYDENKINDIKYLLNRDVFWGRTYPMLLDTTGEDFNTGITTFDEYSNCMYAYPDFGVDIVCPDGVIAPNSAKQELLTAELKTMIMENIKQNVTSLASENPDITFFYFLTPYSAIYWRDLLNNGLLYRQVEAERIAIEEMLKCSNIKLYSFNTQYNITANIDNYRDSAHYGEWVNSYILQCMKEDKCRITKDNYEEYLDEELNFYMNFDYESLNKQSKK